MPALDKPRLRRALRALRTIPVGGEDEAAVAQEALDFLAALAGIKPVYLAGRGFGDAAWVRGVRLIAEENRLHAVEGPCWEWPDVFRGLPDWYAAHIRASLAAVRSLYVCKTRAMLAAVEAACATGAPTIAEEARLLGFPECCVAAHYARARAYHEAALAFFAHEASGDEARMRELVETGAAFSPETEKDRGRLGEIFALVPAPFTSVNMCASCAKSAASPAMRLAKRYGELAAAVDPGYFRVLST